MLPGGARTTCIISHMLPRLDMYYTDPAQPRTTAGQEPDDLYHDLSDLSDLSVRSVNSLAPKLQPLPQHGSYRRLRPRRTHGTVQSLNDAL